MELILTLTLATMLGPLCMAGRLDQRYLPPVSGGGGGGGILAPPFGGTGAAPAFPGGQQHYPTGPFIPIVKYENNPNRGDGVYSFSYETGNGITAHESGSPDVGGGTAVQGGYSYTGPDGVRYSITYVADGAGGFRPQGAHLPTPPPIPAAIAESLKQNAADEARGVFDDGSYRGQGSGTGAYVAPGQGSGAYRPQVPVQAAPGVGGGFTGYRY